jgi:non-heme chloroperoxidase
VLSHCWTGTRLMWAPVARRLVDAGHRVVLYDQRGHGESTFGADDVPIDADADADADAQVDAGSPSASSPSSVRLAESTRPSLTLSRFGDDLATVLAHVDARSAVVAGHSMGGFATMAFACQHPDELTRRVRGLVLVSTAAHGLGAGLFTELACRLLGSGLPARALERRHVGLFIMRGIVGGRRPCYRHLAVSRDLFLATRPEVTAACFAAFADMDLRSALAAVEVPSTVMIGSRDTLTPPSLSQAIVGALPSARLDLVEDAGHLLPLEAPDEVAAAITDLAV